MPHTNLTALGEHTKKVLRFRYPAIQLSKINKLLKGFHAHRLRPFPVVRIVNYGEQHEMPKSGTPENFYIIKSLKLDVAIPKKISTPNLTLLNGGGERDRTDDLLRARQALSQLSYTPILNACKHLIFARFPQLA